MVYSQDDGMSLLKLVYKKIVAFLLDILSYSLLDTSLWEKPNAI